MTHIDRLRIKRPRHNYTAEERYNLIRAIAPAYVNRGIPEPPKREPAEPFRCAACGQVINDPAWIAIDDEHLHVECIDRIDNLNFQMRLFK